MFLENTWSKISAWFKDRSDRMKLIKSFNEQAKTSFIKGETPTVLKASISRGVAQNKHEFSSWFNSGFRITALSGRQLTKDETVCLGHIILSDIVLVRRLIVLGWDTLEVCSAGNYGCRWKLTEYANVGLMLE
ncbi:MAG: hypothetical protein K2H27_02965 [Duncaniella sp.]|nr:hypothetical protein [Duncaniella sp.]